LRRAAGAAAGAVLLGESGGLADGLVEPVPAAAASARGVQRFVSRPDLHPIAVDVVHPARDTAPGLLFIAPSSGPGDRGVMILDDAGRVVWFHSTSPLTAMNFRAALYQGEPVLTWWEGTSVKGLGVGECVIFDRRYRQIARFRAGHRRPADLHEFVITPRGTALVTAQETRRRDLRPLGDRADRPVIGSVIQELQIPSARVLFDWRSLDHVALAESYQRIGPRFDYFHANSIGLTADGNLLVCARNTWAAYKIDRHSGRVMWRLGGKKSDFHMGKGTFFAWQHDARSHQGDRLISIFDNGASPAVERQSRGLLIALDHRRNRATLRGAFTHRPPVLAHYTGNLQVLGNDNVLVGWGSGPYFTEFGPDGSVRFDAKMARGGQTYRALRFPWSGRPRKRPTLVAVNGIGSLALYASWNGATEIVRWQLLTGASPSSLRPEAAVPKTGFETLLTPFATSGYAVAVALDGAGLPLGRSAALRLP
jgi:Arylsulfotransferase (ASST)